MDILNQPAKSTSLPDAVCKKKFIFNSSMPRSGSELIQVILSQNPDIYGSPNSPLLEYQFNARKGYHLPEVMSQDPELMFNAFIKMCGNMAQSYYSSITEKPIIIDKNRAWLDYYDWVEQWNTDTKIICMVRDLRSILASMERIYRANRHAPIGPDNPQEIANMTVVGRINYWIQNRPIGLGLERILNSLQSDIGEKMLFVRYEDLLKSPQETMNNIYSYIKEEPFEHDFSKIEKTVYENTILYGPYGDHKVKPKLAEFKEKDWSDVYNDEIADYIKKNVSWYYEVFKY